MSSTQFLDLALFYLHSSLSCILSFYISFTSISVHLTEFTGMNDRSKRSIIERTEASVSSDNLIAISSETSETSEIESEIE